MTVDEKICIAFQIEDKRKTNLPFNSGNIETDRKLLAKFIGDQGFNYGAEIGVQRGWFSEILCQNIPDLRLICVDPWNIHHYDEGYFGRTKHRLKNYNVEYLRMTSQEAVKKVFDESLNFVYIDAAHDFDNVVVDIIKWSAKVKIGGIVSGHDYDFRNQGGVVQAVNAYTRAHHITTWYATTKAKEHFSWFWVKGEK